ncbi:MAG: alpha/beta hydrolase [bacterium]
MKESLQTIQSQNEKLATTVVRTSNDAPFLIRISGGYNAGHKPNDWQSILANEGIASVAFDFPGVGDSTGKLESTNLNIRLIHSLNVYQYIRDHISTDAPIFILGVSMGGPIAIHMMNQVNAAGLALCVSAAYPKAAWDKNFGEDFSQTIRRENAWKDSNEFTLINKVKCPILFGSALNDEIIPTGITDKYRSILQSQHQECIEYNAPHAFIRLESDSPTEKSRFWADLMKFIQSNT